MQGIDVDAYFDKTHEKMQSIKKIYELVFKKQRKDLNIGKTASPEEIDELISRVCEAIEPFVGKNLVKSLKRIMIHQLRKESPEHFMKKYGI